MPDHTTRETFDDAPDHTKLGLLWDEVHGLCAEVRACRGEMKPRVKKLEGRKRLDTAASAGAGLAGGFLAMLAKLAIWRD